MIGRRALPVARSKRPLPPMMRALRHRNFRLFWIGQMISLVGTWMQALALQWLVYQITGSAVAMGTVAAMTSLPVLLLGPVSGVIVDRFPKQRVVIGTQITAMSLALTMALLTFSGQVQYWHVLLLALGNGTVNAFDMPARQAFLSEMVPDRGDLLNAIALNSSVFNAARIVGPAVAGILVGAVGLAWAFVINSMSFVGVLGGLLMMRDLPKNVGERAGASPLRSFIEGCQYALATPMIRTILLLVLVPSILSFSYVTTLPIMADQLLLTPLIPEGATRLGVLMMANGVGALAGALRTASLSINDDRRKLLVQGGIGFGLGLCMQALNRSFWLALPIMVASGFFMITFLSNANSLLQTTASDRFRGRVMSFYVTVLVGLGLVGSLQAGWVTEHWGAPMAMLIGGLGAVISTLFVRMTGPMRAPFVREDE